MNSALFKLGQHEWTNQWWVCNLLQGFVQSQPTYHNPFKAQITHTNCDLNCKISLCRCITKRWPEWYKKISEKLRIKRATCKILLENSPRGWQAPLRVMTKPVRLCATVEDISWKKANLQCRITVTSGLLLKLILPVREGWRKMYQWNRLARPLRSCQGNSFCNL